MNVLKFYVSDVLFKTHIWERFTTETMIDYFGQATISSEEKIFIDIGANIGHYSALVAGLGHKVLSFKAFCHNVMPFMKTACHHNRFLSTGQMTLYKVAFAESPGNDMCLFSTRSVNTGNARMVLFLKAPWH
jgi:hypothetical protein